jgi:hypothetical protein
MATCYFFVENPVWMLTVGGVFAAMLMPVVAGSTLYIRYAHTDRRIAPTWKTDVLLWFCFVIMLALAGYTLFLQFD